MVYMDVQRQGAIASAVDRQRALATIQAADKDLEASELRFTELARRLKAAGAHPQAIAVLSLSISALRRSRYWLARDLARHPD